MKDLAIVHNLTMSSLEIAELCDKRHDHVLRDIDSMLKELGGAPKVGGTYLTEQGKEARCYHLPKDLTYTLVAGYNVTLRKRIVDRWLELETKRTDPMTIIAEAMDKLSNLSVSHDSRLVRVEENVGQVKAKVDEVAAEVIDIKTRLPRQRVRGTESDRRELIAFAKSIGGVCPMDRKTPMFDETGKFTGDIDHFDGNRGNGAIANLWPLSKRNHKRKTNGDFPRNELQALFDAFHVQLKRTRPKQGELL